MEPVSLNIQVAIFLLRTVTGILFLFQGYDKIFNIKISNVVSTFTSPYSSALKIPSFMLKPLIALSSWAELLCGLLVILGLFQNVALYFLAADMLFVAVTFSMIKPMWDMQFYFPRMIFLLLLLVVPDGWDHYCLDKLLR